MKICKKILCLLYAVSFVFLFCSCGFISVGSILKEIYERTVINAKTVVFNESRAPIDDVAALVDFVTEAHRAVLTDQSSFDDIDKYLTIEKGLLTESEILSLREARETKEEITRDEALYDVDLFFRLMKYDYSGYYYFGGDEVWDKAKDSVINDIGDAATIKVSKLKSIIIKRIGFINDGHFAVQRTGICKFYHYYYNDEIRFEKDDAGYFIETDGEKYYFVDPGDPFLTIDVSLDKNGSLYYGLVYLSNLSGYLRTTISLKGGGGLYDLNVKWTASEDYEGDDEMYHYFREGDIGYVSVRSFGNQNKYLQKFLQTGKSLQKSKYIIIDLRGNLGGYMNYPEEWFYNFAEDYVAVNRLEITRLTKMSYLSSEEIVTKKLTHGKMVENDKMIFVLADNNSASAAELMIQYLKTLGNVVVVGSNTMGCDMFGGVYNRYLPNSGIECYYGTILHLYNNTENDEGVGIKPDIWCDPSCALSCVYEMIRKYEVFDVSVSETFAEYANAEKK